jgi:hypothetical protein
MHTATHSHLLEAAHALQALLLLDGESESQHSEAQGFSAAADAMLKVFNAVAAAPLTHPLPNDKDWVVSPIERGAEPVSSLVQAVLSHACNPHVLLKVGAQRCGVPVNMDMDAGNAWWCNAPLLMQAGGGTASHTSASPAEPCFAAPRRRYICRSPTTTPMQPTFAWPAHHYSSILEKWSSLAMPSAHASQVQACGMCIHDIATRCLTHSFSRARCVVAAPCRVFLWGCSPRCCCFLRTMRLSYSWHPQARTVYCLSPPFSLPRFTRYLTCVHQHIQFTFVITEAVGYIPATRGPQDAIAITT